jgi:hypothetical protein
MYVIYMLSMYMCVHFSTLNYSQRWQLMFKAAAWWGIIMGINSLSLHGKGETAWGGETKIRKKISHRSFSECVLAYGIFRPETSLQCEIAGRSRFFRHRNFPQPASQLKPWPWSSSELYRPSGLDLSTKLVKTFVDRGCRVVSAKDPNDHVLGF